MWYPGKRKSGGGRRDAVVKVSNACERLLDGSYLDLACASGGEVPCWAWINKLAHCDETELGLIARRPFALEQRPDLHSWARTLSFLAHELVSSAARCGKSASALQHDALLPLELELMGATFGPSELTRRVLVALEETSRHRA